MAEILHHLGCMKPYKYWENHLSTGAGFQPSTVVVSFLEVPAVRCWEVRCWGSSSLIVINLINPRDPITERQMMIGVSFITETKRKVFFGSMKPFSEGEPGSLGKVFGIFTWNLFVLFSLAFVNWVDPLPLPFYPLESFTTQSPKICFTCFYFASRQEA